MNSTMTPQSADGDRPCNPRMCLHVSGTERLAKRTKQRWLQSGIAIFVFWIGLAAPAAMLAQTVPVITSLTLDQTDVVAGTMTIVTGTVTIQRPPDFSGDVEWHFDVLSRFLSCTPSYSSGQCYVPEGSNTAIFQFIPEAVASEVTTNVFAAIGDGCCDLADPAQAATTPIHLRPFQMQMQLSPTTIAANVPTQVTATITFTAPPEPFETVSTFPPMDPFFRTENAISTHLSMTLLSNSIQLSPEFISAPGTASVAYLSAPAGQSQIIHQFTVTARSGAQVPFEAFYPQVGFYGYPGFLQYTATLNVDYDEADLGGCDFCAGEPISLVNGNVYIPQTDLAIPGLNGGLNISRTWNSLWNTIQPGAFAGMFGNGWRSNLEERIAVQDGSVIKYWRADGSIWTLTLDPDNSVYRVSVPANQRATLERTGSLWRLTFKDGTRKYFVPGPGSLVYTQDRNGNTTSFVRDSFDRMIRVIDPANRSIYFEYANNNFPFQATSVTSDAGISLFYLYDASGNLIRVTNPDGNTINFEYDPNSLITSVKDSLGKILETHTYDSSRRGLTSSRAGGVDSVTVSYPSPQ